ncbi:nucleoid-associated protein [Saccharicrinis fermentans]|uniref:Nucleoid-associated bacterial protein n=1 Tax=Saccharicrinis fermentans DSM 9555 = JCM 21142 TaxID=869213 RepID=W7YET3_9BACT|nr:nucleoid-associated protein [Saccharicrinis fermentans]GAF02956.1 nucleoid-associated bacterial protein [Saccharicrinis fermentans DSM 9555 = JCM 21142]
MIDFSQATIDKMVVHQVGCRAEAEPMRFSKDLMHLQDDEIVSDVLLNYFFKPFKDDAYYNFFHPEDIRNNPVYSTSQMLFEDASKFYDSSVHLAEYLYENSNHPKIRGGEFYMAMFSNVVVDGELVNAIGIFKSENKEIFLKVYLKDQNFELGTQEGINIKKLDKGCLIFNTEQEQGYKICSIDNINKGNEARFWVDDFLGLQPREDNYYFTRNYMEMCRGFVDDVYNKDNEVARADQIDMLNKSMEFFNSKDNFNEANFEHEVIGQPEVIEAFKDYKESYQQESSVPLKEEFDISKSAVKGQKSTFKSILKLDKNFHVYIHGRRDYVERGYDQNKGLNYYTLYYEIES